MIRKATAEDIPAVAAIYEAILQREEQGELVIGWQRGVYPTEETARQALAAGTLYVMEEEPKTEDEGHHSEGHHSKDRHDAAGRPVIVAAAKIDRQQVDVYADCDWKYPANDSEVLVLHTLVVDPKESGRGHGSAFVAFYEQLARELGCKCLRMDTNERNRAARRLYSRLGYREAGILPCRFNGIEGVNLVTLEKSLVDI